jgi:hypothetical protein
MESTFNEVYYDVEKAIDLSFKRSVCIEIL